MMLQLFVSGELLDYTPLSLSKIPDVKEQEDHIQDAIKHLLEKCDAVLKDKNVKPEFFIKPQVI